MNTAPPTDEAIRIQVAAAEHAVSHRISRTRSLARVAAVGAGTLAIGLIAANILGFGLTKVDPAAASILRDAALVTVRTSDPAVEAGQYLRVETTSVYGNTAVLPDGVPTGWLDKTVSRVYIPSDRSEEWVWERGPRVPFEYFSEEAEEMARSVYEMTAGTSGNSNEIVRAPGGAFYGNSSSASPTALEELPDDPQKALQYIYEQTEGAGRSPDGEALVFIASMLRSGAVPAEKRATLFEAAALIPGIEIVDRQANLEGREGIAIGRVETVDNTRQDLIIDPGTGLLIGEREVVLEGNGQGLPAGTAVTSTATTTSVVSRAP